MAVYIYIYIMFRLHYFNIITMHNIRTASVNVEGTWGRILDIYYYNINIYIIRQKGKTIIILRSFCVFFSSS